MASQFAAVLREMWRNHEGYALSVLTWAVNRFTPLVVWYDWDTDRIYRLDKGEWVPLESRDGPA